MNTYTAKIEGVPHTFTMAKADAERIIYAIRRVKNIQQHWRELTGVIGQDEHEATLQTIFGPGEGTIADPEQHAADYAALIADLPDCFNKNNAAEILSRAIQLAKKHLPVVDKRQTPEQHAAELAEREATNQELEVRDNQERLAFAARYAESAELQPTPEGMQAVTLELNYDDSDAMTDYFHSHCSYGHALVIGYLPKSAKRTEANARAILARYPELAALNWTWHKEDYSMGHGYWLESGIVTHAEGVTTYGHVENPACWWEIQQDGGYPGYAKGYMPFKGFSQANAPRVASAPEPSAEASGDYEVTHERDWTWIKFSCKPAAPVITALHDMGARFSGRRMAWYLTRHVEAANIHL